jgi:hypothetical protein
MVVYVALWNLFQTILIYENIRNLIFSPLVIQNHSILCKYDFNI